MVKPIKLIKLNRFMSVLHAVQAILVLLLATNFALPVTASYLEFDEASQSLIPASKQLFELRLVWLIAGFLIVSSLAHLVISTVYKQSYLRDIKNGINKARWIEYSISASMMMVAISMLVGVYDASTLLAVFTLTAVMNLMGLVMEVHNQSTKKTNWLSYWIGCLAGVVPWLIVTIYFWVGSSEGSSPPQFVYWIFVSIFLFFNCFAINMYLQYKKIGRWSDYMYGEKVYVLLSLVAKSALVWQVFAGTLRP